MQQAARSLVFADEGAPAHHPVLICDRDAKWSRIVLKLLASAGVRVVQTPVRAPNANAHTERFVRSIKEECLDRVVPLGKHHFRRILQDYVEHYHHERNHQGLGNQVIQLRPASRAGRCVRRHQRLGGLLNYYYRAA